ncbi:hypothetical protein Caci_3815 [Catenulispora acidiphila DSM 44928]|uniref:Uncharacterized protein n=1 Tax=Catenulispora acidiphila (strain DSM 44928 / JCM 14897 / NBRC 102108 / NRRL B-24433 / ID139908) TaxID=479433 RepID=C7QDC3_CATAD|nr:hypothetical protein [Catenulispora acidiphila]ACU72716.1 hypothetical protein Caci_3815 [Catenulispora acidiphila DSM 44928]
MSTGADELVAEYLRELEREAARLPWNARTELLEDVRSHIEVVRAEAGDVGGSGVSDDASGVAGASGSPDPSGSSATSGDEEARVIKVREILAALGEPREIVDAAAADEADSPMPRLVTQPMPPIVPTDPMSAYADPLGGPPYPLGTAEIGAVALLLGGFLLAGFGWLLGVILLWTSPRWNVREKLVGTFVLPGGLGFLLLALMTPTSTQSCVSGPGYKHCTSSGWTLPQWASFVMVTLCLLLPIWTSAFLVRSARRRSGTSRPGRDRSGTVFAIGGGALAVILIGGFAFAVFSGSSSSSGVTPSSPAVSYSASSVQEPTAPVSSSSASR